MRWFFALLILIFPQGAFAQDILTDVMQSGSLKSGTLQLFALITILSIAPGIAMMVTCFPFIVTVLSTLRQAIGLQQAPPNMLIISLALFLTYFVMEPVFVRSWDTGINPYMQGNIDAPKAFHMAMQPFTDFMKARVDSDTYFEMAALRSDLPEPATLDTAPLSVLIPSFMLSEISRAFQIGFMVYLPFLVIDLVVSAVLMSMGMMMVPPAMVSLPFKIAFFVVADGWSLVASSLVKNYY